MNKSTIWLLVLIMALTFIGLLYQNQLYGEYGKNAERAIFRSSKA